MKPLLKRTDRSTRLLGGLLALFGFLLLALSLAVPDVGNFSYLHTLLKELGIVVLAVFSISLLYELWLAEKYEERFLFRLREQIEQGETNAAACAYLGIRTIFPTRDRFETIYNLRALVEELSHGSQLRIVGRSLFNLMTRPDVVKAAIAKGARVELCVVDPRASQEEIHRSPDLEHADIIAALSVFEKQVAAWINLESPPGSIEVKCHHVPLLDSFIFVSAPAKSFAAWEFSFGRHLGAKRVFLLEPERPLFVDVWCRYKIVWDDAEAIFNYSGGKIVQDSIGVALGRRASNPAAPADQKAPLPGR